MPALLGLTTTTIGGHRSGDHRGGLGSSTDCSTSPPVAARWVRRSSSPPTARSTTTTRPSRVRASSGCSCWASSCSASSSSRCRCTGCSSPAGRPAPRRVGTTASSSWGSQLFATTADGGFNCAGCHGGMAGVGGEAPFTVTDPITGRSRPSTGRRRRSTRCSTSSTRAKCVSSSTTAGRSRPCRRGDSSAVAR
jgi:hypothetical protein